MKLIILDRDGVINQDRDDFVKSVDEWIPIEGSMDAIAFLTQAGYTIAVATNQSGIGRKYFTVQDLTEMHAKMHRLAVQAGGTIDGIWFCPHTAVDNCECRKPKPGMILDIIERFKADAAETWLVGDSLRDLQAIDAAGGKSALPDRQRQENAGPTRTRPARTHPNLRQPARFLAIHHARKHTNRRNRASHLINKQQGRLKPDHTGVQTAFQRQTFPRYADYPQPDLLVHPFLQHYFAVPLYAACPALPRWRAQNGASLGAHPQLVAQAHHRFELHLKRCRKHSRPPGHHLRQTPKRLGNPRPTRNFSAASLCCQTRTFQNPFLRLGLETG